MLSKVNKHSGIPAYIQIMNMIKKEIIMGRLKEGDKLPPVRELQEIFDVNINTVLKALDKLSAEGVLESQRGIGYFVKKSKMLEADVMEGLQKVVKELKKKGLDLSTTLLIIEEVWKNEKD